MGHLLKFGKSFPKKHKKINTSAIILGRCRFDGQDFWRKVLCLYRIKIELLDNNGKNNVWWKVKLSYMKTLYQLSKHGSGNIMLWCGVGALHKMDERLNGQDDPQNLQLHFKSTRKLNLGVATGQGSQTHIKTVFKMYKQAKNELLEQSY